MTFWVIAPYNSKNTERFDEYWSDGYKNGYISIGWDIDDPTGKSSAKIAAMLKKVDQYDRNAPHTIFTFYNKLKVGDTIFARMGTSSIIGYGRVTKSAYFDSAKCAKLAAGKGKYGDLHRHFIDVAWAANFQKVTLPSGTFFQITIRECKRKSIIDLCIGAIFPMAQDPTEEIYPALERKVVRLHYVIERDRILSAKRKLLDNYTCQLCSLNFMSVYGEKFRDVVETHHIVPLSRLLRSSASTQSGLNDVMTVCPNCHSMIHKLTGDQGDIDAIKSMHSKSPRV